MVAQEFTVDLDKPLVFQVGHLGEQYQEWVHQPIVSKEGPRFFANNILEFLTRTKWFAVPLIWLPVVCCILCTGSFSTSRPKATGQTHVIIFFMDAIISIQWTDFVLFSLRPQRPFCVCRSGTWLGSYQPLHHSRLIWWWPIGLCDVRLHSLLPPSRPTLFRPSEKPQEVSSEPPLQNSKQGLWNYVFALGRRVWDVASIEDGREKQLMSALQI
uniref:Uncharacterized protein n=1 Tax=Ananas comosus var. bracteatus TaxID=296719 RepID=A0A6V7NLY6_ANACO|nr:unnamed protein product [Ananas comosus var. bracteatus]